MKPHIIVLTLVSLAFIPEILHVIRLFRSTAPNINLPGITFRINIIVFLIGVCLLATAILYDVNYINYKKPMSYRQWKTINWSDFRAIKRPHQTLEGTFNFAYICTEINIKTGRETISVETLFHPARSYTFNQKTASNDLLTHELYHFHIAEYCSRLIRKEYTDSDNLEEAQIAVNSILNHEKTMQQQYDHECNHGYLLGQQHLWEHKIDSCLKSLDLYSNPIIKLKN